MVASDERPGRCAAVERLEHRCLDFQETPLIEELPEETHHSGAEIEHLPHLPIDGEIGVALAISHLGVLQAAVGDGAVLRLLRLPSGQRPKRLCQEGDGRRFGLSLVPEIRVVPRPLRTNGHLALLGTKEATTHPDVIVQIEELNEVPDIRQASPS